MFDTLTREADDPLLALTPLFKADPNPAKVDLGVGVYRDELGRTPIFRAVKRAEARLLETQETKAYVGPEGDRAFIEAFWTFVAGEGREAAGVQTVGGTGALRLAAELLRRSGSSRIFLGTPTWSNHSTIFQAAELAVETYPLFDVASQRLLAEHMISVLADKAQPGDAILLHASCHNPTGAVMDDATWEAVAEVILEKCLVPLIDSAYQGFGTGIESDAGPLRRLLDRVPEAIVAASASKSFGLYRERTGAVYATSPSPATRDKLKSHLVTIGRGAYSMPPDHGAAVVRTILTDPELREDWRTELDGARQRITAMRAVLAEGLTPLSPALAAIATQQGMFSLLPIDETRIVELRQRSGIYMPLSGRINIAGLNGAQAPGVIAALRAQAMLV